MSEYNKHLTITVRDMTATPVIVARLFPSHDGARPRKHGLLQQVLGPQLQADHSTLLSACQQAQTIVMGDRIHV